MAYAGTLGRATHLQDLILFTKDGLEPLGEMGEMGEVGAMGDMDDASVIL